MLPITRILSLVLGVVAIVTGRGVNLSDQELLALAVGLAGVYQLVSRFVLHRQAKDLGVPDSRKFFATSTAWMALFNAFIAVAVLFTGIEASLPTGAAEIAQLLAFVLAQDRLLAGAGRATGGQVSAPLSAAVPR